jgi:HK97 family phage major capsid protein
MSTRTLERKNNLAAARAVVDTAMAESRPLTPAEAAQVQAQIERVKELDAQAKSSELARRVLAMGANQPVDDDGAPITGPFSAEAKAGIIHAAKTRTNYRTQVDAKAALTTNTMLPPSGTTGVPGLYAGGAFPLSSLFTQEQAEGPVVRYYRMGAGTAGVVAEGAPKPDAGVSITSVDLALEKLACTAQFSDEMADDAPYLVNYLAAELQAAVATAENARILNTFGSTSGILTASGATADAPDVIADAIAGQEAISGKTPTAVVANPSVIAAIRKSKASTSGTYVLDVTAPGPSTLHGVPLISTPATAAGTAWVIEASGVTIYRRGQLSVEIGTNADNWITNTRTMRAEERVAAAVRRPSCLTKITLS